MSENISLKVLRAKHNLSQSQLAKKLGYSQQHVSAIETADRKSERFYKELKKKFPEEYKK
jgi:transcriptional regulator with XRE-family HTH domain